MTWLLIPTSRPDHLGLANLIKCCGKPGFRDSVRVLRSKQHPAIPILWADQMGGGRSMFTGAEQVQQI